MDFAPHSFICNDSYELIEKADSGGFGSVWQARNVALNKIVALKFLKHTDSTGIRESLRAEGQKIAQVAGHGIYSRNIVYAHHFFPGDERTPPFLELEWVDGGNVTMMLTQHRILPVQALLRLALDVAGALATAHKLDLIHCDIKPSNILCSKDGAYKLTDFGLSRVISASGSRLPHGGTLPYMSPEQFMPRTVLTPATDIYSLGCVLFQCCEGHTPYGEANWAWQQYENAHTSLPAPTLTNASIPSDLSRLIDECLNKDPAQRPVSDTVLQRLEAIAKSLPASEPLQLFERKAPAAPRKIPLVRLSGSDQAEFLHPYCDMPYIRLSGLSTEADDHIFLPQRLATNRDFLHFLAAPENRNWQPSLITSENHDGEYLASWSGDLPSIDITGQILHSIPYMVAAKFSAWVGGRLPTLQELRQLLAHPHSVGLRDSILAYIASNRLTYVQFWCLAEDNEKRPAPMLRYPEKTPLGLTLDAITRPRHFCLPHHLFIPIIPTAHLSQFVITDGTNLPASRPSVDRETIEREMESFIDQFMASHES